MSFSFTHDGALVSNYYRAECSRLHCAVMAKQRPDSSHIPGESLRRNEHRRHNDTVTTVSCINQAMRTPQAMQAGGLRLQDDKSQPRKERREGGVVVLQELQPRRVILKQLCQIAMTIVKPMGHQPPLGGKPVQPNDHAYRAIKHGQRRHPICKRDGWVPCNGSLVVGQQPHDNKNQQRIRFYVLSLL